MPEPIGSAPNDAAKRPGSIGLKPSDACCQTLEARPIQALRGCAGETVPPELPPVTGAALRRGETERFSIFRWNKILEATFSCNPRKTKPIFPNSSDGLAQAGGSARRKPRPAGHAQA